MSEQTSTVQSPPPPLPPEVIPAGGGPQSPRRRGSGTARAGIVLIVIGLVFLAGQFLPVAGWWNLWPAIIIIAGLIQAFTPGRDGWSIARMFDGFTTVAIGGVFLAIVFGVVGWSVWATIFALWPVLVISIGLDLLGKALDTSLFKVVGSLLVIAALVYAVAVNAQGTERVEWFAGDLETGEMNERVGSVDEASLKIEAGVARVELQGGSDLVRASGSTPFGEPRFSIDRNGDQADVLLSLGTAGSGFAWYGQTDSRLDASISDSVTWDITVEAGVSSFEADLRDVDVRSLQLKPGVAECDVTLGDPPARGEGAIRVQSGISSVVLRLPESAQVRVESKSGLTGIDIARRIEDVGDDRWETDGFQEARDSGDPVWIVRLESGIGSFTIDTY
ncbi:MAG: LiaF transmembrane domain-containing protein [Coriobacteriia bacterium]